MTQILIARNAGDVYNHRFYFNGMNPPGENSRFSIPIGALNVYFKNFEKFKEAFKAAALSVFGSGYAWFMSDCRGKLKIITTANQKTPLFCGLCPLLNIDVWEHTYYLKHFNKRADYINDWFDVDMLNMHYHHQNGHNRNTDNNRN